MADFGAAVGKLLDLEGGCAARDNRAGAVNYGITERFLRSIGSKENPRELTRERAADLYRVHFWDFYQIGEFADQRLAFALFAELVNMPPGVVVRCLQRAANQAGGALTVDGRLGRLTRSTVNVIPAAVILPQFKEHLLEYYKGLAAANPSEYADDLPGWRKRLEAL